VPFQQDADAFQLSIPEAGRDPNITVVKLTIDGDPLSLAAIVPVSSSKSLAYLKPATASSSIAPQFMHTAQAVLDDDDSTYWTPGRDETLANEILGKKFEHVRKMPNHPLWIRNGWIEVDLESPTSITHARIHEHAGYSPVSSWKIEYDADGEWRKAAEGTTIGKRLDVPFPTPVTARKFRLLIEAVGRSAISEFQLFQDSPP
jgi:hypothetical protein